MQIYKFVSGITDPFLAESPVLDPSAPSDYSISNESLPLDDYMHDDAAMEPLTDKWKVNWVL